MQLTEYIEQIQKEIYTLEGEFALSVKFINSQEKLEINSEKQFWAASVIKIPISCEFFRQVGKLLIDKDSRIKISESNIVQGTGIIKIMDRNDKFTALDLVKLMLTLSDNTATNQIVDLVGIENIEIYMRNLSMNSSTFRHKMMIKAGNGPNYTTTKDMGLLFEKLYRNELPGSEEILGILKYQMDRTRIPLYLPNEIEISHKPGTLPEAMHDVGIVYSQEPFIFAFLSDEQKDKRKTNEVLSKCAKLSFDYAESKKLNSLNG